MRPAWKSPDLCHQPAMPKIIHQSHATALHAIILSHCMGLVVALIGWHLGVYSHVIRKVIFECYLITKWYWTGAWQHGIIIQLKVFFTVSVQRHFSEPSYGCMAWVVAKRPTLLVWTFPRHLVFPHVINLPNLQMHKRPQHYTVSDLVSAGYSLCLE